ncbi:MAG: urease accessory protein UreF [Betaproteobacteria bacterium]|nr:urease accessory protein UreF [Betaproteobacteria bacterium]
MARKKRPAPLLRSSPRKRGPRAIGAQILNSRLRGNEREKITPASLYRLMTWLSPSYPIGAFSYSSGIEWAVECGDIAGVEALRSWLAVMMAEGAGFCDGVLFAHAHRAVQSGADVDLRAAAELAAALVPTRERFLETTAQGRAFVEATRAAWPCPALNMLTDIWDGAIAYPIAVGVVAAGHDIPLDHALPAYLHTILANWTSAGIRLVPLGQTDGQRVLAALESVVAATVQRASAASLDDVGGAAFRADLASVRHETQYTRLFRS